MTDRVTHARQARGPRAAIPGPRRSQRPQHECEQAERNTGLQDGQSSPPPAGRPNSLATPWFDVAPDHRRLGGPFAWPAPSVERGSVVMHAAEFATRVAQVRHRGDHYVARCPAHEDRSPSLTFRDGQRGLLVHCWAGCSLGAIAHAVGAGVSDLFYSPGEPGQREIRRRAPQPDTPERLWRRVWTDTLRAAVAEGRHWAIWDPIFARADVVRHADRAAHAHRMRATGMQAEDPAMWDEAALAVLFDDEARLVEIEADELTGAARRARP
jgi:hypothetical protein